MAFCEHCGTPLGQDARFCGGCGRSCPEPSSLTPPHPPPVRLSPSDVAAAPAPSSASVEPTKLQLRYTGSKFVNGRFTVSINGSVVGRYVLHGNVSETIPLFAGRHVLETEISHPEYVGPITYLIRLLIGPRRQSWTISLSPGTWLLELEYSSLSGKFKTPLRCDCIGGAT
jgi:hypothetical protein